MYYFIHGKILDMIDEVDENFYPDAVALSAEQVDFFIKYPDSSWEEVQSLCLSSDSLQDYKLKMIEFLSTQSFVLRQVILPDYKLINASLGIYGEDTKLQYSAIVNSFRNEFYRLRNLIDSAAGLSEIDVIVDSANFPDSLI